AFVTALNAQGNGLFYSTFLGGLNDDQGLSIALDSSGNAYVGGITNSASFPILSAAAQGSPGGGYDAFVTVVARGGFSFLYSTFLGGFGDETSTSIALDPAANIYVTGGTASPNFPLVKPIQAILKGPSDAFVAKISHSTGAFVY